MSDVKLAFSLAQLCCINEYVPVIVGEVGCYHVVVETATNTFNTATSIFHLIVAPLSLMNIR